MSTLSLITVSLNKGNICATSASLNLRRQTERNLLRKNLFLVRFSMPSGSLPSTTPSTPTRAAETSTFSLHPRSTPSRRPGVTKQRQSWVDEGTLFKAAACERSRTHQGSGLFRNKVWIYRYGLHVIYPQP